MTDQSSMNAKAILLFAATGLAMGAIIGWLSVNSWLGIGFLVIIALFYFAFVTELDFLSDIAVKIAEPVWKMIARAGEQWAGTDPDQPVYSGLKMVYAAGFVAGVIALVLIELPLLRGDA